MHGLGQRVLAPLAQAGPGRVARDRRHVAPAALALHAAGALDRDARLPLASAAVAGAASQLHLGDDEQHRQLASRSRSSSASSSPAPPTGRPWPAASCRSACPSAAARSRASTRSRSVAQPRPRARAAPRSPSASSSAVVGKQREVHRLLARAGQVPPQLVGRERQDRRQQPRQAVGHDVHRRLRRPPLARPGGERVQPILRHVGVEGAQVDRRERVQRLEDRAVVVVVVRRAGRAARRRA